MKAPCRRQFTVFLVLAVWLTAAGAEAQQYGTQRVLAPRRAGGIEAGLAPGAAVAAERGQQLAVRELIGTGKRTQVATPQYRTSARQSATRPKDWVEIKVTYDTAPDWIDRLTVQYHVLAAIREDGAQRLSLYRASVDYFDIAKGREHMSTVYLHPHTVARHGMPMAVHVELLIDGELVGAADDVDAAIRGELQQAPQWWSDRRILDLPTLTVRDGALLNRRFTPFYFVDIDDQEVQR